MNTNQPTIHVLPHEKYDLFRQLMKERHERNEKVHRATAARDANGETIGFDFPCDDGSVVRVGPDFFPWTPHEHRTWPFRYMTTKVPLTLHVWNQKHPVEENTTDKPLPIGTRVKIVMVSRFGDVGITDDLTAEFGYHLRGLQIDELASQFENFSMEP